MYPFHWIEWETAVIVCVSVMPVQTKAAPVGATEPPFDTDATRPPPLGPVDPVAPVAPVDPVEPVAPVAPSAAIETSCLSTIVVVPPAKYSSMRMAIEPAVGANADVGVDSSTVLV